MANDKIIKSVRADSVTFDRLAALAKKDFGDGGQGAALEALLNLWDLQNAKENISDRQAEIADFDMHLQALQRGYIHALDLAQDADARAMDTIRAQMESKDKIIADLQERLDVAKTEVKLEKGRAETATADAIAATESEETAKKSITMLEEMLERERQTAAANITALTDKQKIIDSQAAEIAELREKLKEQEDATKTVIELKADLTATRNQAVIMEKEAKNRLDAAEAAAKIDAAKAESRMSQALQEADARHHIEYKRLVEEITRLKDALADAQTQINTFQTTNSRKKRAAAKSGDDKKK